METIEPCEFLPWDSDFFGHRIGQVKGHRLTPQLARAVLDWCQTRAVECVYFLADSDDAETVRVAEHYGFSMVDIRVALECNVRHQQARLSSNLPGTVHVRPSRQADIPALQAIARTSYVNSRFYFDPRFPVQSCEALYEAWIKKSCENDADVVLVAELTGQPVGFVSCHVARDTHHGRIGLVGVDPEARGRGVGQTLMNYCLRWFAEHGVEVISVVTQGRNIAAQRLYQRCGFLTRSVQFWYHKWVPDCLSEDL